MPDILLPDIWIYENEGRNKKLKVILNVWLAASGAEVAEKLCFHRCISSQYVITHTHTNMYELSTQPHSNPHGLKPRSPHINEATPIFHHGRCVAVATRPFHLLIPHWVCIFRLAPSSPPLATPSPPPSQSITLSSHLSPLIGLFLSCPPSKY